MRRKTLFLVLWLASIVGWLLAHDYAHSSCGADHGGTGSSPATKPPTTVKPVLPGIKVVPTRPFSPKVDARDAATKAQMIAQIKVKYAQQKHLITQKYTTEMKQFGKIYWMLLKKINSGEIPESIGNGLLNQYGQKSHALQAAYHQAITDLEQRKNAEIQSVYGARRLRP